MNILDIDSTEEYVSHLANEKPVYDDETGRLVWASVSIDARDLYDGAYTAARYYALGWNAAVGMQYDVETFAARYARLHLDAEIDGVYDAADVEELWTDFRYGL